MNEPQKIEKINASKNDYSDPTSNVLMLVEAANRRQDDLRAAESRRVNEMMELRAEHAKELGETEKKRLDAIRVVDVNAVAVASERASQQALVLANQVSATSEILRGLVATTNAQLTERLSSLEKSQYERKGSGTGMQQLWALAIGIIIIAIQIYSVFKK